MEEHRREKDRWHLSQLIVEPYGWSHLAARRVASRLYVEFAACPKPPVEDITMQRGKRRVFNFEDSLLVSPLLCLLMLAIACCGIGLSVRESAWVENPDIKEGSLISATQSPFAAMSSLAPSCVLADAPERCSPVMGCRCGSMQTSLHTSDRRLAVRSLISLCLIDGKPPFGQDKACST